MFEGLSCLGFGAFKGLVARDVRAFYRLQSSGFDHQVPVPTPLLPHTSFSVRTNQGSTGQEAKSYTLRKKREGKREFNTAIHVAKSLDFGDPSAKRHWQVNVPTAIEQTESEAQTKE